MVHRLRRAESVLQRLDGCYLEVDLPIYQSWGRARDNLPLTISQAMVRVTSMALNGAFSTTVYSQILLRISGGRLRRNGPNIVVSLFVGLNARMQVGAVKDSCIKIKRGVQGG